MKCRTAISATTFSMSACHRFEHQLYRNAHGDRVQLLAGHGGKLRALRAAVEWFYRKQAKPSDFFRADGAARSSRAWVGRRLASASIVRPERNHAPRRGHRGQQRFDRKRFNDLPLTATRTFSRGKLVRSPLTPRMERWRLKGIGYEYDVTYRHRTDSGRRLQQERCRGCGRLRALAQRRPRRRQQRRHRGRPNGLRFLACPLR